MSGPATTLPFDIKELQTVEVTWESFQGMDGHGSPMYASPVTLTGWLEESGMIQGGEEAIRMADMTSTSLHYMLFLAGDDPNARQVTPFDRFTLPEIVGGPTLTTQAQFVNTFFGPNWDNQAPWLIQVSLA